MTAAGPLPNGRRIHLRRPEAECYELSMTVLKPDRAASVSRNGLQGLFKKTKVVVWRKPLTFVHHQNFRTDSGKASSKRLLKSEPACRFQVCGQLVHDPPSFGFLTFTALN